MVAIGVVFAITLFLVYLLYSIYLRGQGIVLPSKNPLTVGISEGEIVIGSEEPVERGEARIKVIYEDGSEREIEVPEIGEMGIVRIPIPNFEKAEKILVYYKDYPPIIRVIRVEK